MDPSLRMPFRTPDRKSLSLSDEWPESENLEDSKEATARKVSCWSAMMFDCSSRAAHTKQQQQHARLQSQRAWLNTKPKEPDRGGGEVGEGATCLHEKTVGTTCLYLVDPGKMPATRNEESGQISMQLMG